MRCFPAASQLPSQTVCRKQLEWRQRPLMKREILSHHRTCSDLQLHNKSVKASEVELTWLICILMSRELQPVQTTCPDTWRSLSKVSRSSSSMASTDAVTRTGRQVSGPLSLHRRAFCIGWDKPAHAHGMHCMANSQSTQ